MIKYILEEAKVKENNWDKTMESRLALVLNSIKDYAKDVVDYLLPEINSNRKALYLLLMIYMSIPSTGKYLEEVKADRFTDIVLSGTSTHSIDSISHTLLSALTATSRNKDWARKSQDLEICMRKLAATHPELVLRQLPMLAGSLRGRAQYDWGVLKSRGHMMLFGQALGLLELLQPKVFEHTEALCNILDSYFRLLQYHGHMKDLSVIVTRIVTFLQNWMIKDIRNALKYLHQYGNVLK